MSSIGTGFMKPAVCGLWLFGLALAALVPVGTPWGAAWAQESGGHGGGGKGGGGHEDGGHEDGSEGGGHEDGDHEEGGGKGKGKGKPPAPVPVVLPVSAQEAAVSAGAAAARKAGNYVRFELGSARSSAGDASWLPPGYPEDPQVFFDLDLDNTAMGALAIGRDYGNGWRGEVALNIFGTADFAGPWSYTVPETEGPHAAVTGSVSSIALMANGYRDFDLGGAMTPFVTVGLGLAHNSMGDWTRISPDPEGGPRRFRGDSDTGLAWSVGLGVSWDIGPVFGSGPAKLDLTWRYFDLGSVSGSTQRLDGMEGGRPVEALNFDRTDQVIGIGLRIPL